MSAGRPMLHERSIFARIADQIETDFHTIASRQRIPRRADERALKGEGGRLRPMPRLVFEAHSRKSTPLAPNQAVTSALSRERAVLLPLGVSTTFHSCHNLAMGATSAR